MLPTVETNELVKLYFNDVKCSFYYDPDGEAWVLDPDDEEQDAVVLESPEHPFESFTVGLVEIDLNIFKLMKEAYEIKTLH